MITVNRILACFGLMLLRVEDWFNFCRKAEVELEAQRWHDARMAARIDLTSSELHHALASIAAASTVAAEVRQTVDGILKSEARAGASDVTRHDPRGGAAAPHCRSESTRCAGRVDRKFA